MSGLTCARGLHDAGHDVVVLDKGRSVGGRMATRRDGDATFDHGAQFFTVRSEVFQQAVDQWTTDGVVHEWCRGFANDDGHPRYVASAGMNALAKHLAIGLDVRCSITVQSVTPEIGKWCVSSVESDPLYCDVVVVTSPLPQTVTMLQASGVEIPEQIRGTTYDPTVGLLAVVSTDSTMLSESGGIQDADEVFSFIADNRAKQVSKEPAITFHANPQWSSDHFEMSDEWLHEQLLLATQNWLGDAQITSSQIKKWRYAIPKTCWTESFWANPQKTLILAGDAFNGPKIEGAYLSGYAAVTALA